MNEQFVGSQAPGATVQIIPCAECGEPYPAADLHTLGEIYCEKCRASRNAGERKAGR